RLPVFVVATGGKPRCPAWIATPFILERAKSPRGGDAKRQLWVGNRPRGLLCRRDETSEEPVRPAIYGDWKIVRSRPRSGDRLNRLHRDLPCSFCHPTANYLNARVGIGRGGSLATSPTTLRPVAEVWRLPLRPCAL